MNQLYDALPVLIIPFLTCLVIAALHCYMGLHVIRRGVIFVDLALAQCAALGAAAALALTPLIWDDPHAGHDHGPQPAVEFLTEEALADQLDLEGDDLLLGVTDGEKETASVVHEEEHERFAYFMSLTFALLGAVVLSFARFKDDRIPHEAIIGIIFVVCAALSVLILSKAPHGHDKMEAMLVGSILFVNWGQLFEMLGLYLALGVVHVLFRRRFITISGGVAQAEGLGINVKLWDCIFFATFALMVTQSVGIAGVFVVFSYLIIPAACGSILGNGFRAQLLVGWLVALLTTIFGLAFSALADMPTGSSLVSSFGLALVVCTLIHVLRGGRARPGAAAA